MKKNGLFLFLVIILLVGLLSIFDNSNTNNSNSNTNNSINECELNGCNYETKSDSNGHWSVCRVCGDTTEVEGHKKIKFISQQNATCLNEGYIKTQCHCGYEMTEILEKTDDHNFDEYASDENGHWLVCTICGVKDDEVTGHLYTKLISETPATCAEEGSRTMQCNCGHEKTESIEKTDDHNFDEYGSDGNGHWLVCTICGVKDDEVTEHLFTTLVSETAATCINDGSRTMKCGCGEQQTTSIPKNDNHSFNEDVFGNDSTGHWNICDLCGVKNEVFEHVFNEHIKTVQPTCAETGYIKTQCYCGYENVEVLEKTDDHNFVEYDYDGKDHWLVCSVCGIKDESTSHIYSKLISETPATCAEEGSRTMQCNCGHEMTESIEKTDDHNFDEYGSDENGHWLVCTICGATDEVTEHLYTKLVSETSATCAKEGSRTLQCNCGHEKTEATEKTDDHNFDEYGSDENGHWLVCTICGATDEVTEHLYSKLVSETPSTCAKEGSRTMQCNCGHKKTESISKLEHDYELDESQCVEGNCTTEQIDVYVCSSCGYKKEDKTGYIHNMNYATANPYCAICGKTADEIANE